jgi:hypothetical protein
MSFDGLLVHFFLAQNNIPLPISTVAYESFYLLKNILSTFKFYNYE